MIGTRKINFLNGCIDSPADGDLVFRHGFNVCGWYVDDAENGMLDAIEARVDGIRIGSTVLFFDRPDVHSAVPNGLLRCGFELLCTVPEGLRGGTTAQIEMLATYNDGSEISFRKFWVRFSPIDYRVHGHGYMLTDGFSRVLRREDVYGSGPPSPVADGRCADLVRRYIDSTQTVLDVGCGIGAYGKVLLASGVKWHGVEVIPDFCARMTAEALPNTLLTGSTLPFKDRSYESAISIEVLEHIDDYGTFLVEIARVVRGTVCFSVPNAEGIPLMSYMHALPWHMLESDHKNFFSRGSLKELLSRYFSQVEVFTYGNLPNIRSYDGVPIANHLFAVARNVHGSERKAFR
jgi:2-polyprenyl-3-methyl-5-hydroxy-6-metoxy-1,4-benzoquinol methylase